MLVPGGVDTSSGRERWVLEEAMRPNIGVQVTLELPARPQFTSSCRGSGGAWTLHLQQVCSPEPAATSDTRGGGQSKEGGRAGTLEEGGARRSSLPRCIQAQQAEGSQASSVKSEAHAGQRSAERASLRTTAWLSS